MNEHESNAPTGSGDGPRRDNREDRDDRGGGRRFGARRRGCEFCIEKIEEPDYKDVSMLRRYVTDRGKIEPRRKAGTCAKHQRRVAVAVKPSGCVAVMVVLPMARAVARTAASIVATRGSLLVQVTVVVRSWVVPSVRVPVAVNGCVCPIRMLATAGLTARLARTGGVTVRLAVAETVFVSVTVAVIVVVPTARPVATPVLVMDATVGSLLVQVAVPVRSRVLPSV